MRMVVVTSGGVLSVGVIVLVLSLRHLKTEAESPPTFLTTDNPRGDSA